MEPVWPGVRGRDQEAKGSLSKLFDLAMAKFRSSAALQKFASIHASVYNHFNQERHLYRRKTFKLNRAAAVAEWRKLAA